MNRLKAWIAERIIMRIVHKFIKGYRRAKKERIQDLIDGMVQDEKEGCVEWLVETVFPDKNLVYLPGRKPGGKCRGRANIVNLGE